ncbi:MAG: hypothetical protein ABMB14_22910, partial [Myxococcota bacterium]
MLRSVRSTLLPAFDAAFENHAAVHQRFRFHAVHARNLVTDDALLLRAFDRLGRRERSVATVVLAGAALIRTADDARWVTAGEGFALADKLSLAVRCEAAPTYRAVVFEWSADLAVGPVAAPLAAVALPAGALAEVERLWQALREPWTPAAIAPRLVEHLTALRAAGVPLAPVDRSSLAEPVPPRLAEVSEALDAQLSDLAAQPMSVDLEARLGLSSRQLSRLVRELNQRYGFNADGWLDVRNRRRVMVATALLSDRRRPVTEVARVVGYTSAQVMARALADAGLPA